MPPDDPGRRTRRVDEDAIEGPAVPPVLRLADVGGNQGRRAPEPLQVLADAPEAALLDVDCDDLGQAGRVLEQVPGLAARGGASIQHTHARLRIEQRRFGRVRENLERLGRTATLVAADVSKPQDWWDRKPFDRILIDAPCSSTGVIRRHPDIKILRRLTDIAALAGTQRAILEACFSMLAPGGRLIYATCSVLPAENQAVLAGFLENHRHNARGIPATLAAQVPGAEVTQNGVQLLPGSEAGTDGFHYACVEKTTRAGARGT